MAPTVFVDLNSNSLLGSATATIPLSSLPPIKRGASLILPVQFVNAGVVTELSAGATGILGFKAPGYNSAASYAAVALSWVKTGTGTAALYTFTVTFINTVLNAILELGGAGADLNSIVLNGEIKWADSNGTHETTPNFKIIVLNDINQGGESVPVTGIAGPITWLPNVTQLTGNLIVGGVPQSLDAVPTVGVFNANSLLIARIAGTSQFTFDAGAADVTDPGQVAPTDYNAVTNNFHWTKRS
jgi:hypothetical protein